MRIKTHQTFAANIFLVSMVSFFGLIAAENAVADMECGGSLGKLLFSDQIKTARAEWAEVSAGVKSCLSRKSRQSSEQLADKCIGPKHSKIAKSMEKCLAEEARAEKARNAEARRLAAEAKARERAKAQARKEAEAAKARPEAYRQELIAKYGHEMAMYILAETVVTGMNAEQVLTAVGEPTRKDVIPPNYEIWIYARKKISFSDQKVSYVDSQ